MDWNWFFSTFAQCGAAIIGLFGAFIVSTMINTNDKITESILEINKLLNSKKSLKNEFKSINIQLYNRKIIESNSVIEDIRNGIFDNCTINRIHSLLATKYNLFTSANDPNESYTYFIEKYSHLIINSEDNELLRNSKRENESN